MSLSRGPLILKDFTDKISDLLLCLCYYIHGTTVGFFQFAAIPFIIEHAIATVRLKEYEKKTKAYFGISAPCVQVAVGYALSSYISVQFKDVKTINNEDVYPDPLFPKFMCLFAIVQFSCQAHLLFNTSMSLVTIMTFNQSTANILPGQLYDIILVLGTVLIPIAGIMFHSVLRKSTSGFEKPKPLSLCSNKPIPPNLNFYYFEVDIIKGGVSKETSCNNVPLGFDEYSVGYHGNTGKKHMNSVKGELFYKQFGNRDTVGCGLDIDRRQIFFTKNGRYLGVAYNIVPAEGLLFPTIGLCSDVLVKQRKVQFSVTSDESGTIKESILKGQIFEAIKSLEEDFPYLLLMDKRFDFALSLQDFIESIRESHQLGAGFEGKL
uniref:B30.2/SPRY domain-containing protein n=1 Tax=Ditylenchus dipsaci TaxID=166011 RepID=A0A915DHZ1_9BILA